MLIKNYNWYYMRRFAKYILIITLILLLFCAVGCHNEVDNPEPIDPTPSIPTPSVAVYTLSALQNSVELREKDIFTYDFTSLFEIRSDSLVKTVLPSYIDISKLPTKEGVGSVSCTYEDQTVSVKVTVLPPVYDVELKVKEVSLFDEEIEGYDFNALFTVTKDGEQISVTDDMVTTNLSTVKGEYSYTVTKGGSSKTLKVIVNRKATCVIYKAYQELSIPFEAVEDYDYLSLFNLYVDGTIALKDKGVLDTSEKSGKTVGDSFNVTYKYTISEEDFIATIKINVVSEPDYEVNAKSIVVYPNSGYLDLTSLFEITKEGKQIPVTIDMISGEVDYQSLGVNTITLLFNGVEYNATVEVKRGVLIETPKSVVTVRKGTDKQTYAFADDFILKINGVRFEAIDKYVDSSSINFDEVGEYTATLTVKYNENTFSLTKPVAFEEYSKSITYLVVENEYEASVKEESVVLVEGTESYNIYSNISVTINGKKQAFVENPDSVDVISCYVKCISEPIDFTNPAVQEVVIEVYVNGVNATPIELKYNIRIQSTIEIETQDIVAFTGDNVYPYDMFKVYSNGIAVDYDKSCVSGVYSLDVPGVYTLEIEYERIKKSATLTVLDRDVLGIYETALRTIAVEEEIDDEGYVSTDAVSSKKIGNMEFLSFDSLKIAGVNVTELKALENGNLYLKLSNWEYEGSFSDGIAFINPINKNNFNFSDSYRPFLYINNSVWTIEQRLIINEKKSYVLEYDYAPCYSIDAFKLKRIDGSETKWIAMKTDFLSHMNNDYIYSATCGECTIAEGTSFTAGSESYLIYDGKTYSFELTRKTEGQVTDSENVNKNSMIFGKTFEGVVDGKNATIRVSSIGRVTYVVGSSVLVSEIDIGTMANGGFNSSENSLLVYDYSGNEGNFYSYKFLLDLTNSTFVPLNKDVIFGKFVLDNVYYFFDGYKTGVACFDSSSYTTYAFEYDVFGSQIDLIYKTSIAKEVEEGITSFFLDDFKNVITERIDSSTGRVFENSFITEGAIVTVSDNMIGSGSSTVAKNEFLNSIKIVTKDGELTVEQKKNVVKTNTIKFSEEGFYQYSITLPVGDKDVTSYYAVRIIPKYEGIDDIIGSYSPTFTPGAYLIIDEYGRVKLTADGVEYIGFVTRTQNGFISVATNNGKKATIQGTLISNGLFKISVQGDARLTDFFTSGTIKAIGCEELLLREYTNGDVKTYAVFNMGSFGEICEVVVLNDIAITEKGAILKILFSGKTVYAKVNSWSDLEEGLTYLRNYIE